MSTGRILLLDPSLRDEAGHHYYAARSLLDEAGRLGRAAELFCHRSAKRQVRALPARRHFKVCGYTHEPGADRERERRLVEESNSGMLADLRKLGRLALEPDDLVLFPAITANLVLGAARWIGGFDRARAPRFGVCLMFQRDWHPSGAVTEIGAGIYEKALASIPGELRERVVFTCETEHLARDYRDLLGETPLVLPVPTIQHLGECGSGHVASHPKILCLGYSKPEKGTHLLPDIVEAVGSRTVGETFLVQLSGHESALIRRVRRRLAPLAGVSVVEGTIPPEQMVDIQQRAGLMLLPYDPVTYRTRGSALFTEARTMGLPVVVPAGTAMGEEVRRGGGGELFSAVDASAIADAVCRALERLPELTEAAKKEAERLRRDSTGYLAALDASFAARA